MFWKNFQIKVKNEKLLILYLNGLFILFNLKVLALKIEKIESILKPKTDFEEERPNNLVQDDYNRISPKIEEKNENLLTNDAMTKSKINTKVDEPLNDHKNKKPKTNLNEERPIDLVQDDHDQINLIINEKNELIYEYDSIRIHLKEGNILNEPSDILVAPTNCDLKLIGKLSDFSLNTMKTLKKTYFRCYRW